MEGKKRERRWKERKRKVVEEQIKRKKWKERREKGD